MRKHTQLSVNINKIATLRNARGKDIPNLCYFAKIILKSKAIGITVHPRPDERHIRFKDVQDIKKLFKKYPHKEFNIEGYPSSSFLNLIKKIKPQQCTLVPDPPHVITSNAGWDFVKNKTLLKKVTKELKNKNIRVSLFLDPLTMKLRQYQALKEIAPQRVEFYTEAYARVCAGASTRDSAGAYGKVYAEASARNSKNKAQVLQAYKKCAKLILKLGIELNAGHDLNEENLKQLLKTIPQIKEVSIGQALIASSLERGLLPVINSYLKIIKQAFKK